MNELERRLVALRAEIAYPDTPSFELELETRARRPSFRRLAAVSLAILVVVLAGVLAISPAARSAFAEVFNLGGATVVRVDRLPPVERRAVDLGEQVTRTEAERRVGFRLVDVGEADAIFVRDDRLVSLVYGSPGRPRLVLSALRGEVWDGFVAKMAAGGTRVDEVDVDGERGLFLSGDPHIVMFVGPDGAIDDDEVALAGTVLLWNRGPLLLRLEADVTLDEALELARAVG